jgi:hypothetical protein
LKIIKYDGTGKYGNDPKKEAAFRDQQPERGRCGKGVGVVASDT